LDCGVGRRRRAPLSRCHIAEVQLIEAAARNAAASSVGATTIRAFTGTAIRTERSRAEPTVAVSLSE
ncbi:hypothetical protein, partial [Bradyrhizobium brasilense]|uniref:hypothetical protein n=1 Tax=Bradyrhizobium brasilense TaxID=1419277 RepID=UPI001E4DF46C